MQNFRATWARIYARYSRFCTWLEVSAKRSGPYFQIILGLTIIGTLQALQVGWLPRKIDKPLPLEPLMLCYGLSCLAIFAAVGQIRKRSWGLLLQLLLGLALVSVGILFEAKGGDERHLLHGESWMRGIIVLLGGVISLFTLYGEYSAMRSAERQPPQTEPEAKVQRFVLDSFDSEPRPDV